MKRALQILLIFAFLSPPCWAQRRSVMSTGDPGGDDPPPDPPAHPGLFFNSVELAQNVGKINDPGLDPSSGVSESYSNMVR